MFHQGRKKKRQPLFLRPLINDYMINRQQAHEGDTMYKISQNLDLFSLYKRKLINKMSQIHVHVRSYTCINYNETN